MITDALIEALKLYIKEQYKRTKKEKAPGFDTERKGILPTRKLDKLTDDIKDFIMEQQRPDFKTMLESLRIAKGLTPKELYKAAWIDKRVYSKIKNGTSKPKKDTALQFAFALKLDMVQFADFLKNAEFALSDSSKRDLAIRFCMKEGIFDLYDVNALLDKAGEKVLCKEPKEGKEDNE